MEGGEAGVVAVTKVFAIRVRLDDRVRYITDGEKTSLASSITYISNPEKTEQFFFTSALNCSSVDTALSAGGGHTRAGARYRAGICQAVVWKTV